MKASTAQRPAGQVAYHYSDELDLTVRVALAADRPLLLRGNPGTGADGMAKIAEAVGERKSGLIFANLVDFDMLYGHRKDVEGFAESLEEFDAMLGPFLGLLRATDLLLITADHGCDPDPRWVTTDHSREYVPILAYSPGAHSPGSGSGVNLGIRKTLADMGQTVAEYFGGRIPHGTSFLKELSSE